MQKADSNITQRQDYLNLLTAAEAIITQYEEGQLDKPTAQSQLKDAYRKIHHHEQSSFEQMLSRLEESMTYFIKQFYADKNQNKENVKKMMPQAIFAVGYMNENLDYMLPLILKPTQVKFLLTLLSYLTELGSYACLIKDFEAAHLLTGFTANRLVEFIMTKIFMVTVVTKQKHENSLQLVSINMTTLGEWAIQQHLIALFKAKKYEIAEEYLFRIEDHLRSAKHYKQIIPSQAEEYFQEHYAAFKADLKINRTLWKKSIASNRFMQKRFYVNSLPSMRYYLWSNSAVYADPPQLSLALCYLNLAIDNFEKLRTETPPIAMYELYKVIAAKHVGAKHYSAAVVIYETMLQRYDGILRLIPDFAKDIINMQKTLATLKIKAFQQLMSVWQTMDHTHIADVAKIQFDEQSHRLTISKDNMAWLKILSNQLQLDTISYHLDKDGLRIILSSPYLLCADDLQKYIDTTESQFVHREAQLERRKAALNQSKPKPVVAISTETDNSSTLFHEPTSPKPIRQPKTTKTQLLANNNRFVKKPAQTPQTITISWGNKFPLFHPTEGCVYPIPNPEVKNSGVPCGIFYGYIDTNCLPQLKADLLEQFELVLARGKLVAKGDPHGIRAVRGELPANSPYLFKINLHGEDLRLYGRKVADKTEKGEMIILIAFDQAIGHDESLQLNKDQHSKKT